MLARNKIPTNSGREHKDLRMGFTLFVAFVGCQMFGMAGLQDDVFSIYLSYEMMQPTASVLAFAMGRP